MSKKNKENIEEVKDLENKDLDNQNDENKDLDNQNLNENHDDTNLDNQNDENENENENDEPESYKLKILIAFTDKYTNEKYKVGDVIEVNKERYIELINDVRVLVKEAV